MKTQNVLAAMGFVLLVAISAFGGNSAVAHGYNWQCPDGTLSETGPTGCGSKNK